MTLLSDSSEPFYASMSFFIFARTSRPLRALEEPLSFWLRDRRTLLLQRGELVLYQLPPDAQDLVLALDKPPAVLTVLLGVPVSLGEFGQFLPRVKVSDAREPLAVIKVRTIEPPVDILGAFQGRRDALLRVPEFI